MPEPTVSKLPELVIFGSPLSKSQYSATIFHANVLTDNILPKVHGQLWFQVPSSYGLGWTVSWIFWTKGSPNESMNKLINDKGVYRTAPATPGLLNSGTVVISWMTVLQWFRRLIYFSDFRYKGYLSDFILVVIL